jgi:glycerol uptake facilitator protein
MEVYIAEFIGTMILILLGDGVVAGVLLRNSKAENSGWIVITFGWGMAVAIAVYSVGAISGAHINPAVTIGLASIGAFEWAQVPGYVIAQFLGAFTGAVLVWLAYLPHWEETADPGLKLGVFCTAPAIYRTVPNLVTEIIGTAMLLFGVLGIVSNVQQIQRAAEADLSVVFQFGLVPLIVGLLVLAIGLSLGGPTGYAINPARDLGPRIAHAVLPIAGKGGSDWSYAWIPVVGPIIGGILGAVLYSILGFGS